MGEWKLAQGAGLGLEKVRLEGSMFRGMIYAAANRLNQNKEKIDFLNVYPVPDGDTGTNMSLTFLAAAKEVEKCSSNLVGELATAAAKGSLMGARGNSGVILSQLLRGFAQVMQDLHTAGVTELARGLQEASAMAYKAVMRPVEGTMLTVARYAAEAGKQAARRDTNVVTWLEAVLQGAKTGLSETPKMLSALAEAGVVDAGGQGIVTILTGAYLALKEDRVPTLMVVAASREQEAEPVDAAMLGSKSGIRPVESLQFQYCTELIVRGGRIPLDGLREQLHPFGDSLLVVGDLETVKVHIHSNNPGQVLEICGQYGEMFEIQINNMVEQNRQASLKTKLPGSNGQMRQPSNLMQVSSTAKDTVQKETGIVAVTLGDGWKAIYEGLGVDVVLNGGHTMNPSTEELVEAISIVPARQVIVLPNNKNVIFAAEQAAKVVGKKVAVIPTTGLPQGVAAATVYDENLEFAEAAKRMEDASKGVVSGEVTYAVRDTTTDGIQIKERDFIGLEQGKVMVAGNDLISTTKELIRRLLTKRKAELVSLFYGRDVIHQAARELLQQLRAEFPDPEWELYEGGQPLYYYLVAVE
ncbi:MAG: DAK2 domain-containing protein [Firmicutes bacterium]|nr:DAK2 domain-containing protein [Bacillota bacterium]